MSVVSEAPEVLYTTSTVNWVHYALSSRIEHEYFTRFKCKYEQVHDWPGCCPLSELALVRLQTVHQCTDPVEPSLRIILFNFLKTPLLPHLFLMLQSVAAGVTA